MRASQSCACLHQDTFISQVSVEVENAQSVKMKMKAQWMSEDKLREQFKEQLGPPKCCQQALAYMGRASLNFKGQ